MFPKENESNKHTESVHTKKNQTAVDHKCEKFSYWTIIAVNYLEHMFNTHTPYTSANTLKGLNL